MREDDSSFFSSVLANFASIGGASTNLEVVSPTQNASASEGYGELSPSASIPQRNDTSNIDNATVSDSEVISSMRFNAILGSSCLFFFGLLNAYFKMYRIRLSIRRVTEKPPELPKRGWAILWMWLWRTLTVSDEQLLFSAGLDALMFVKTVGLGVQLFCPLAIIGSALLIPIHEGQEFRNHKHYLNSSTFVSMTVSNVRPGSSVIWIHFVCVYLYIGYTLLLLYYHQKRFINLRHRFLNASSQENIWRTRIESSQEETENQEAEPMTYSDAIRTLVTSAFGVFTDRTEEESSQSGALSRLATMKKTDTRRVLENFKRTGSVIERNSTLSTNLSFPNERRSGDMENQMQTHGLVFNRMRSPAPQSETRSCPSTPRRSGTPPPFTIEEESSTFRFPQLSTGPEITESPRPGSPNSVRSDHIEESVFSNRHEVNQPGASVPPLHLLPSIESKPDEIVKWWFLRGSDVEVYASYACKPENAELLLPRPSVRFLKTVNTQCMLDGCSQISVSAQLYCVLLTNFPKIDIGEKKKPTKVGTWLLNASQLFFGKILDKVLPCEVDGRDSAPTLPSVFSRKTLRLLPRRWSQVRDILGADRMMQLEQKVVSESFATFFPEDFVQAMPIRNHRQLDLLLARWDSLMAQLERSEYYNSVHPERKTIRQSPWWSVLSGYHWGFKPPLDAVEYYHKQIKALEDEIRTTRAKIMHQSHASSWLIIFRTQKTAAIASQVLLHTENNEKFKVEPAPGPDEMNWQSLWKTYDEKRIRMILVIPFMAVLISFPLGIFAGSLSQLNEFLCGDPEDDTYWSWYCDEFPYRKHIAAWVPAILVAVWQNIVLPNALYYLVQASGSCNSLSQVERRIAHLFFMWDTGNIFLGAMVGGSVLYKINEAVKKPQHLMELIGISVPASSNFFVNYVILRAFFLVPYQLLVPHPGIIHYVLRCGGRFGYADTARDRARLWAPRSLRYGREYGVILLMFLISIAYSVIAPIILPFTLAFFLMAWLVWRYQVLYVFVRKYESGGRMWPLMVKRLIFSLWIFQIFTCCVFVTKEAYWQAAILWISVPLILRRFYIYSDSRFLPRLLHIPLEMAHHSPPAEIHPDVYTAPALLENCAGWHPEYMKAWEGWNSPAYTI